MVTEEPGRQTHSGDALHTGAAAPDPALGSVLGTPYALDKTSLERSMCPGALLKQRMALAPKALLAEQTFPGLCCYALSRPAA